MSNQVPEEYVEHLAKRGFIYVEVIGHGLSGTVVRAEQRTLERPVAVKFCDSDDAKRDPNLRKRFSREARLLARIQHQAIPYVLTVGETPQSRVPYTVLEFIEGKSLRRVLTEQGRLDRPAALKVLTSLLEALKAAHKAGVVHRDVKPENVMVTDWGCVLIDFSIGYAVNEGPGVTRATRTGDHLGTVNYMCPEQLKDMSRVDHRCDLYSTGIVLYEMLLGTPHVRLGQLDIDLRDAPVGIREMIRRSCAADPTQRFESADEFAAAAGRLVNRTELDAQGPALCRNTRCPQADWSPNGYYRGPRVIESTVDRYCDACGAALEHHCAGCGSGYRNSQFCGGCGTEWYSTPTCETCGSLLKLEDMGTDTKQLCCVKGQRKRQREAAQYDSATSGYEGSDDDDIPF